MKMLLTVQLIDGNESMIDQICYKTSYICQAGDFEIKSNVI